MTTTYLSQGDNIENAIEDALPGDRILLKPGTWNDQHISLSGIDGGSNKIKIRSGGSRSTLVGNKIQSSLGSSMISMNRCKNITFENIEFKDSAKCFYIHNSQNIHLDNISAHKSYDGCIYLRMCKNCSVKNSQVYDSGWNIISIQSTSTSPNGRECSDIAIENNLIYGSPGETNFGRSHGGVDLFLFPSNGVGTGYMDNIRIINNKFYDIATNCIMNHKQSPNSDGKYLGFINNCLIQGNEIKSGHGMQTAYYNNTVIKNNYFKGGTNALYPEEKPGAVTRESVRFINNVADDVRVLFYNKTKLEGGNYETIVSHNYVEIINNDRKDSVIYIQGGKAKITYTDGRDFTVDGSTKHGSYDISGTGTYRVHNSGSAKSPSTNTPAIYDKPFVPPIQQKHQVSINSQPMGAHIIVT